MSNKQAYLGSYFDRKSTFSNVIRTDFFFIRQNPLSSNQSRRLNEDRHAIIFMGIVIAFVLCHCPRVALDLHEIFTLEQSNRCQQAKMPNTLPSWVFIGMYSYCYSM